MLVQVVALLSLGVLCSSAPTLAPRPNNAGRHSLQEEPLVGLIVRELLQDMQKLNLNEVPTVATVNATVERCMHSHLKTFARTLAALDVRSKLIARKLTVVNNYKHMLPEDGSKITLQEKFLKPIHIKDQICAHSNTKRFIQELKKMTKYQCMQRVEKDMKSLEEICSILKKSSSHDKICCKSAETDFSQFKKGLEEFLKWVNGKKDCSNIVRSELGLYPDGNCVCHDQWKYRKGLL
ncbi:interleukin-like precursor [Grus japonensis]|uniref:Interleukin-like n=1 Tax=Grus japonensis TaxID=30415 RepID=A0ABC9XFC0_GRUJA